MMSLFILMFLIVLSNNSKHPMLICIVLVSLATQISFFLSKYYTNWIFFLLILLFLGGMMVLFVYTAALMSNFKPVFLKMDFFYIGLILLFFIVSGMETELYSFFMKPLESLFYYSSFFLLILSILFLLLLLIFALSFVNKNSGNMKNLN